MPDDYTPHSTNQTAENVIHLDHVRYTNQRYDSGVDEVRLVEATYLGHTTRGFTTADALRKLAERIEADSGPLGLRQPVGGAGSGGGE